MADLKNTPYLVSTIATGIYRDEFDSDSSYSSLSSISGWLENNVGLLNTRLYSEFNGSGLSDGDTCVQPTGSFNFEESDIYKQMFLASFYNKKVRTVLNGIDSSVDFISLKEGDSVITRTNKNEIAKTYRGLAKDSQEKLEMLVAQYNIYNATPVQVAGNEGLVSGYSRRHTYYR